MVMIKDIDYAGDGSTMIGRLALPEGDDQRPAVLIAHEGGGLDDYQKSRAERFAELGCVAFALDYHGGGKPLADENAIMARCQALWNEPDRIRALAGAGLEVLLSESRADASRVAAVGYCFGGAIVLELARGGADAKAVVGIHPRLATRRPQDSANIRGKVLVCVGTDDPLISVQERLAFEEEMRGGHGGLEDEPLRRHRAQLHQPGIWVGRAPRGQVPPALRPRILASDARPLRRGVSLSA
jgi:dienelactone hydrolase